MPDTDNQPQSGAAALAKGGRTNFFGFLLRLGARLPFLLLAARLYGAADLGRFAYASMAVELVAAMATLGLKRGLAAELAQIGQNGAASDSAAEARVLTDGLLLSFLLALVGAALMILLPQLMFPGGMAHEAERWFAVVIPAIVLSDVALAGLAFRHRIDLQVRARSVVEPWVLIIVAVALAFTALSTQGLLIAYVAALLAAMLASLVPVRGIFGWPVGWRPSARRLWRMARRNLPVAGADIVEWTSRRLDVFILGRLVSAEILGIYFVAQQVATLAGKLRVSFDPILAPMLAAAVGARQLDEAAAHVRQVGFWVLALQIPVVMALALPGEGVLGLFGPEFAAGALVLALLLSAELAACVSGVSEMGLIYSRPRLNLLIALSGLALQAGISIWLIPHWGAVAAAAALLAAMIYAGILRQLFLWRALDAAVGFWRPSLFAAAIPAFVLGWMARRLPELPQMLISIPGVLLVFALIIWRHGFGPEDRTLFARKLKIPGMKKA